MNLPSSSASAIRSVTTGFAQLTNFVATVWLLVAGTACSPRSPIAALGQQHGHVKVSYQARPRTGTCGQERTFEKVGHFCHIADVLRQIPPLLSDPLDLGIVSAATEPAERLQRFAGSSHQEAPRLHAHVASAMGRPAVSLAPAPRATHPSSAAQSAPAGAGPNPCRPRSRSRTPGKTEGCAEAVPRADGTGAVPTAPATRPSH